MSEKVLIGGILESRGYTLIKILGIVNEPGYAGKLLSELGAAHVNLEFIAESEDANRYGNITICVKPDDAPTAMYVIKNHKNGNQPQKVEQTKHVSSITVYGPHFRDKPAVSGQMCTALGDAGVNILGISTSISSVCCLINDSEFDAAMDQLLKVFQLP
jgi:aspartokinase